MTFKTQLDNDMENVFLSADEYAENITYTPKGGTAKTIPAIIDRFQTGTRPEDQARVPHRHAEITIQNDATNGVTEIDTKGDKVNFAQHPGDDAIDWDIVKILESSESCWKLEVEY